MKKVLSLVMASVLAIAVMCVATVQAEEVSCTADQAQVTVHYQKFEGAYEGAALYNWLGFIGAENTFEFSNDQTDEFGAYVTVCVDKTKTLGGDTGEIIIFSHGMPAGTTNLTDWNALNAIGGGRIGADGHNLRFDGTKYNAALATGEVHLYYLDGMFLEATNAAGFNYEMAVSDGDAENMAAAQFEATKFWNGAAKVADKWNGEEGVVFDHKWGYATETTGTVKVVFAHPDQAIFEVDGEGNPTDKFAYQAWCWVGAKQNYHDEALGTDDSVEFATTMTAVTNGVKNVYGIAYISVQDDESVGPNAGFKFRLYGGWVQETNNFSDEFMLLDTTETEITDLLNATGASHGLLEVFFLWGVKSSDFRVNMGDVTTAGTDWLVEINAMKFTSAEFLNKTTLQFTVTKDVATSIFYDADTAEFADFTENVVVNDGTNNVEVAEFTFDYGSATVRDFRVVLATDVDTTKTYTIHFEFEATGATYEADSEIAMDTEAPVIAGAAKFNIKKCGVVTIPSLTAVDNKDGDISGTIYVVTTEGTNHTVDTSVPGDYEITFAVEDAMGNVGTKTVTYVVTDDAAAANAASGLILLGLLPAALVGVVAFRKFSM